MSLQKLKIFLLGCLFKSACLMAAGGNEEIFFDYDAQQGQDTTLAERLGLASTDFLAYDVWPCLFGRHSFCDKK